MDHLDDDGVEAEIIRSYVLTNGRTRTAATELAIETILVPTNRGRAAVAQLPRDQRRIVDGLMLKSMSVAEISAHYKFPLRTAILFTSEMVAGGLLEAGGAVANNDRAMLLKIHSALQRL